MDFPEFQDSFTFLCSFSNWIWLWETLLKFFLEREVILLLFLLIAKMTLLLKHLCLFNQKIETISCIDLFNHVTEYICRRQVMKLGECESSWKVIISLKIFVYSPLSSFSSKWAHWTLKLIHITNVLGMNREKIRNESTQHLFSLTC